MYQYTILLLAFLSMAPFNAEGSFSINSADQYLSYSYAAYCPSVSSWGCTFCESGFHYTETVSDAVTGGLGYVGYISSTKTVVVAFRGSSNIQNWILNVDIDQESYPGVSGADVHQGFYEDYLALQEQVISGVTSAVSAVGATSVVVTGHSLGAALATIAALDLVANHASILRGATVSVYNYGSPRVGNQAFANYYNSKVPNTYRCTFEDDIVPHVPPELSGFYHVSNEYHWSTTSSYKACSGGEDSSCADGVGILDYSISDHTNYFGIPLDQGGC